MECNDIDKNRIVNAYLENLGIVGMNGVRMYERMVLTGSRSSKEVVALVDTGATIAVVPQELADDVGLCETDKKEENKFTDDRIRRNFKPNLYYGKMAILSREIDFICSICDKGDICYGSEQNGKTLELNHPILGLDIMKSLRIKIDTTKYSGILSIEES